MSHNEHGKITLAELLVVAAIILLLVWFVLVPLRRRAIEARQARCRQNLQQLTKGMTTYLGECGDNRYYMYPLGRGRKPDSFTGAEWLATIYWTQIIPDPGVFVCPNTPDTNDSGRDIGRHGPAPRFSSRTISYAGLHYRSFTGVDARPLPIYDDLPPFFPSASDDTEGTLNHGDWGYGGMNVLFLDSHVEFFSNDKLDPRTAVGATGPPVRAQPLLWRLRN